MGMCAKSLTNGMNVAAPRAKRHGKRYSKADKMKASKTNGVNNERQTVPFVPKTAPLVLQFSLRSSRKRRCCAKAVS